VFCRKIRCFKDYLEGNSKNLLYVCSPQIKYIMNKALLKLFILSLVLVSFTSCSVEPLDNDLDNQKTDPNIAVSSVANTSNQSSLVCAGADPQGRLVNNGTYPFNFKVYSGNGTLISQELNVMPGASTNWTIFSAGDVIFSIESITTGVSDMKSFYNMIDCTEIDIVIDATNVLVATQPVAVI